MSNATSASFSQPSQTSVNANPSGADQSQPQTIQAPSSLYLITFAVTLSLLLSVSCAILSRNVILRHRERRLREAIAAGLIVPAEIANRHGISIVQVTERPTFWDVWVPWSGLNPNSKHTWGSILPVSATAHAKSLSKSDHTVTPTAPRRTFGMVARSTWDWVDRKASYLLQLGPPIPKFPKAPAQPAPGEQLKAEVDSVNLAVFIAMPNAAKPSYNPAHHPHHHHHHRSSSPASSSSIEKEALPAASSHARNDSCSLEDEGLPELMLGIVDVALKPDLVPSSSPTTPADAV